jgi:hypothetical protein
MLHTSFAKRQLLLKKIIAVSMNFSDNSVPQYVGAGPLLTLPLVCNVI